MYSEKLVKDQIGPTKKFIELTRPLLETDYQTLVETLLYLDLKSPELLGSASEIVKLQKQEIINEIALRN